MKLVEKVYSFFLGRDVAYFIGGAAFYIGLSIIFPQLFRIDINQPVTSWQSFIITFIFWHITGLLIQEIFIFTWFLTGIEIFRMVPPPELFVYPEQLGILKDFQPTSISERVVFLKQLAYDLSAVASLLLIMMLGKYIENFAGTSLAYKYILGTMIFIAVLWFCLYIYLISYKPWKLDDQSPIINASDITKDEQSIIREFVITKKKKLLNSLRFIGMTGNQLWMYILILTQWSAIIITGITLEKLNNHIIKSSDALIPILITILMWGFPIARRFLLYEELLRLADLEANLEKHI